MSPQGGQLSGRATAEAQGIPAATSQWPPMQAAWRSGGGNGRHPAHGIEGEHNAALSALWPELLTAVHSPCEPHSQQSRPLRRRQSALAEHFENSGTKRVSKGRQCESRHCAAMYGLTLVAHRGQGVGTGHVEVWNASVDLEFTPAKLSSFGMPHTAQQPVVAAMH
jgi:hypothetical protein